MTKKQRKKLIAFLSLVWIVLFYSFGYAWEYVAEHGPHWFSTCTFIILLVATVAVTILWVFSIDAYIGDE
jgi:membrane protein DedA with SNARE-associated domain